MSTPSAESVARAARALSGQVVATPWVGEPFWPGRGPLTSIRFKLECLQPSGSAHFRGALYALGRRRGSLAGIRLSKSLPMERALAIAAVLERIPIHVDDHADPRLLQWLARRSIPIQPGAGPQMAPLDPDDLTLGIATLGLEIAREAPSDVERVLVPLDLVAAVELGLGCAARSLEVQPCAVARNGSLRRSAAIAMGLRLDSPAIGVLAAALESRNAVAIL